MLKMNICNLELDPVKLASIPNIALSECVSSDFQIINSHKDLRLQMFLTVRMEVYDY